MNNLTQAAEFTYPASVMLLGIVIETGPESGSARFTGPRDR